LRLRLTYDQLNRTTNIAWNGGSLVNPISQALTYDLAGNITNLAREHGSYTLAYDNVDQLVSSSSSGQNGFVPYNRNFTYDLLGNRLSDSVNGAGSFVSNFLTQNGVSNYQADPDGFGDLTTETSGAVTKSFGYRADGRLNSFSSSAIQANYYYDALGRRVAKAITKPSENFTQSYLHVLQADRILQAKAGDGSITTYLDGNGVDQHLGEVKGGVAKGYVTDHLGSVLNSDVAGASNQFGLFGEVENNPTISSTSNPVMYGFTGREWDAESSTNYHRARNYQPETGRWLSQEPTSEDGPHLYHYVFNNPVSSIDSTGLFMEAIIAEYTTPNEQLIGGTVAAATGALAGSAGLSIAKRPGGAKLGLFFCAIGSALIYEGTKNAFKGYERQATRFNKKIDNLFFESSSIQPSVKSAAIKPVSHIYSYSYTKDDTGEKIEYDSRTDTTGGRGPLFEN